MSSRIRSFYFASLFGMLATLLSPFDSAHAGLTDQIDAIVQAEVLNFGFQGNVFVQGPNGSQHYGYGRGFIDSYSRKDSRPRSQYWN